MEHRTLGSTGISIPVVGQGTWNMGGGMGRDSSRDDGAVEALKLGFQLGMTLIDTAEMYGAGHSEELVAQAIQSGPDGIFVASKVSPSHFEYDSVLRSATASLKRL